MNFKTIFVISVLILSVVCVSCEADTTGHDEAGEHDHDLQNISPSVQANDKKTNVDDEYDYFDLQELNRKLLEDPKKEDKFVENNNNNLENSVLLNSEKQSNLIEQKALEKQTTPSNELNKPQEPKQTEQKTDNKLDEHFENEHGNHTHTDEVKNKDSEEISTNQIIKFIVLIGVMIVVAAALSALIFLVIKNRNKKSSSIQTNRKPRQIYHPVNQTDSNI